MQTINIEGFGPVNFPADMSDADIKKAIETNILPKLQAEKDTPDPMSAAGRWAARQEESKRIEEAALEAQKTPITTEKEATLGSRFIGGAKQLASSTETGVKAIFGSSEEATKAAQAGLAEQERIAKEKGRTSGWEETKKAYETAGGGVSGVLAGAGEFISQVPGAVAENLPQLGTMFAGARVGALGGGAIGSVVPGVGNVAGAVIGGIGGAAATMYPQFFGSNAVAQAEEAEGKNVPFELNRTNAAVAAAGQTALEAAGGAFALGKNLVSKLLSPATVTDVLKTTATAEAKKAALDELVKTAGRSLVAASGRGAVRGVAEELPVEVLQQILEDVQAGRDPLSPEGLERLGQAAYGALQVGPVLGGGAGAVDRSSAKSKLTALNLTPAGTAINPELSPEERAAREEEQQTAGHMRGQREAREAETAATAPFMGQEDNATPEGQFGLNLEGGKRAAPTTTVQGEALPTRKAGYDAYGRPKETTEAAPAETQPLWQLYETRDKLTQQLNAGPVSPQAQAQLTAQIGELNGQIKAAESGSQPAPAQPLWQLHEERDKLTQQLNAGPVPPAARAQLTAQIGALDDRIKAAAAAPQAATPTTTTGGVPTPLTQELDKTQPLQQHYAEREQLVQQRDALPDTPQARAVRQQLNGRIGELNKLIKTAESVPVGTQGALPVVPSATAAPAPAAPAEPVKSTGMLLREAGVPGGAAVTQQLKGLDLSKQADRTAAAQFIAQALANPNVKPETKAAIQAFYDQHIAQPAPDTQGGLNLGEPQPLAQTPTPFTATTPTPTAPAVTPTAPAVVHTPDTAPSLIDDSVWNALGIGKTAKIRKNVDVNGKDITHATDGAFVRKALEAYRDATKSQRIKDNIDKYLARFPAPAPTAAATPTAPVTPKTPVEQRIESGKIEDWAKKAYSYNKIGTIMYADNNFALIYNQSGGGFYYSVLIKGAPSAIPLGNASLLMSPSQLAAVTEAHALIEARENAALAKTPDGPFTNATDNVVASASVDPRYVQYLIALMQKLGMGHINMFLFHDKDLVGNRDLYNLHGPYSVIVKDATQPSAKNSAGWTHPYGPAQDALVINLSDTASSLEDTLETISHELGHGVEFAAFVNAPKATQDAIIAEYRAWKATAQNMTIEQFINSLRNRFGAGEFLAKFTPAQRLLPATALKDFNTYWLGFAEWFADNVSRWASTDKKAISLVAKFFQDVAKQLRALVAAVTGVQFAPASAVADFLNKMGPGSPVAWQGTIAQPRIRPKADTISAKDVGLRPERTQKLVANHAYTQSGRENDTKGFLTRMSPMDFIDIASTPAEKARVESELEPLDFEKLKANDNPIRLTISVDSNGAWKVVNHDGRHRMWALHNAGYTSVPVLLSFNSSVDNAKAFDTKKLVGARDAIASSVSVSNGEPLSYSNYDKIVADYSKAPVRPQTDIISAKTSEFKSWFGDSKVVDKNGEPLRVYHGTNKTQQGEAFKYFDTYGSEYGLMGQGSYFTDNPDIASEYTQKGRGTSPTVYPVYLSLQNPIDMDARGDADAWSKAFTDVDFDAVEGNKNEDYLRAVEEYFTENEYPKYEAAQSIQEGIMSMGHDGITHVGGGRFKGKTDTTRHQVYIAFEPNQIKSVFNQTPTDASEIDAQQVLPQAPDTPEFNKWFGDSPVVDKEGKPLPLFRSGVGDLRLPEGFLNAEPREGYAVFASDNPYVSATYGQLGDTATWPDMVAATVPMFVKATKLIEFPVGRRFDMFEFDRQAQRLKPGEVLVARQVYDQGPRATLATDPKQLYSYASDIYAWNKGTSVKSAYNQTPTDAAEINAMATAPPIAVVNNSIIGGMAQSVNTPVGQITPNTWNLINQAPSQPQRTAMTQFAGVVAQGEISWADWFRQKTVDVLAPVATKLGALFDKGVRNSFGDVNPVQFIRQAFDHARVALDVFKQGGLRMNKDGFWESYNLKDANGKEMSARQVIKEIADLAKKNNEAFGVTKAKVATVLEGMRLSDLRKENATLETLALAHEAAGDFDKADKTREKKILLHMRFAEIDALEQVFNASPELYEIRRIMHASRESVVDAMITSGRISQERGDFWKSVINYVPFDRIQDVFEDISLTQRPTRKGITSLGELPAIRGSLSRPVANVVDNYMNTMAWMVEQSMRNSAAVRTLNVMATPGVNMAKKLQSLKQATNAHMVLPKLYENGEPVYFEMASPYDFAAFVQAPEIQSGLLKFMGVSSRLLRTTVTATPMFAIKQVIDDAQRVMFYSGVKNPTAALAKTLAYFPRAWAGAWFGKESAVERTLTSLGIIGDYDFNPTNPVETLEYQTGARSRGGVKWLINKLEQVTKASDMAARLAVYEQTMKETGDAAIAQTRARELINFNRRGSSSGMRTLTHIVPFFNAYAQGMDLMYRGFTGKDASSGLNKAAARKMFVSRVAMMTAMGTMYALAMSDDDQYEDLTDEVRDRNWILPKSINEGFGSKFPIKISVPSELGFIFKSIPERVVTYMKLAAKGQDQGVAKAVTDTLVDAAKNYSITPIPALIKPVLENITNYSTFTHRELVPKALQALPASMQTSAGTSEVAKAIGKASDVSPIKVDNWIRGTFGLMGSSALMMSDVMMNPARPDRSLAQIPFANIALVNPAGSRTKDEFYEFRQQVTEAVAAKNMLEKENPVKYSEFVQKNYHLLAAAPYVNQKLKTLSELRAAREMFTNMPATSMSSAEKRKNIDEINEIEKGVLSDMRTMRSAIQKAGPK